MDTVAALLSELCATKERVIAISLHNPDIPGMKGRVISYDSLCVEFQTDSGKVEILPIAAYKFRRIEKEEREKKYE